MARANEKTDRQLPANLDLALDLYLTAQEAAGCTKRTIGLYRWVLTRFLAWLGKRGLTVITGITAADVRAYVAEFNGHDLKPSYIHTHVRSIKTFLRFLHAEQILSVDVAERIALPRLSKEPLPAFSAVDVGKLLAASTALRDTALILTLLDTGVRANECCQLRVSDFDRKENSILVRIGKGKRARTVFVGPRTKQALLAYLLSRNEPDPAEPLFPSQRGGALTPNSLLLFCRRLGKRAGVAHCAPHTFRRSFALACLNAGMNIYALQRLMGHSDLDVLMRYLDLTIKDLQTSHTEHGAVSSLLSK